MQCWWWPVIWLWNCSLLILKISLEIKNNVVVGVSSSAEMNYTASLVWPIIWLWNCSLLILKISLEIKNSVVIVHGCRVFREMNYSARADDKMLMMLMLILLILLILLLLMGPVLSEMNYSRRADDEMLASYLSWHLALEQQKKSDLKSGGTTCIIRR